MPRTSRVLRRLSGLLASVGCDLSSVSNLQLRGDRQADRPRRRQAEPSPRHARIPGRAACCCRRLWRRFQASPSRSTTAAGPQRKWTSARRRQRRPRERRRRADLLGRRPRQPGIQGDRAKVLDALVGKKGVGLGFAHYAVEVPPASRRGRCSAGLAASTRRTRSGTPWAPPIDKFPDHPVTSGVGPFSTHDEWYFNMRWTPTRR